VEGLGRQLVKKHARGKKKALPLKKKKDQVSEGNERFSNRLKHTRVGKKNGYKRPREQGEQEKASQKVNTTRWEMNKEKTH